MRFFPIAILTAGFAAAQPHDCTANGTVVNALTGVAITHAQVVALPERGASTDATGAWSIAGLPCGGARFTVNHAGFLEATGNAGEIRMTSEAVISGTVFDEAGDAIAKAEVQLLNSVVKQGRRVMSGSASVNANTAGAYRIGQLRAGRYMVCARSSQVTYPMGGGSHIPYGEICSPAFPLQAGEEHREDFHLPAVPGVHVRGTIFGAPSGAHIVVEIGKVSEIAHDGKFDLAGVVPGSYTIEGLAVLDGATRFAAARIDVGAADVEGVELTFVPSVEVTGTVRYARGKLPESLKVNANLIPSDPGFYAGMPEWDASDSAFGWSALPPGKYRVTVNVGPDPYYIQSVSLEGREIRGEELTITGSTGPIEVAVADDGGQLEGSVADADGKPAAAEILLLRGNLPPLQARSGEDGRFTMVNVPPGDYLAYAFDDSRNVEYAEPEWMRLNAGLGAPVSIAPWGSATVSLVRTVMAPK
ncbi:MAG: carboxypeptidase-like regulatory domain-containing protein [Bryobacteraceae bacterium]|jgi:hypothetical protein